MFQMFPNVCPLPVCIMPRVRIMSMDTNAHAQMDTQEDIVKQVDQFLSPCFNLLT